MPDPGLDRLYYCEALLMELVQEPSAGCVYREDSGDWFCAHCQRQAEFDRSIPDWKYLHEDDCLIARARRVLGLEV